MHFDLSEDQLLLKENIHHVLREKYVFKGRNQLWNTMIQLGWTAIPFAEMDGGLNGSHIDLMNTMIEFGKHLVVEPYLANVVLAGGAIKRTGSASQKDQLITAIIDGSLQCALAFQEQDHGYQFQQVTSRAYRYTTADDLNSHRVTGTKVAVLNADRATTFIVSAVDNHDQLHLYLVDETQNQSSSPALIKRSYKSYDGYSMADLRFHDAIATPLGHVNEPHSAALQQTVLDGLFCLCSEALGIMETVNGLTLSYAKERIQFAKPIGSFQVLQHRMVDMLIEYEKTKSLVYRAVIALNQDTTLTLDASKKSDSTVEKAIYALKIQTDKAAKFVGQQAIQIHGGMGMSDEMLVGQYFKRLAAISTLLTDKSTAIQFYLNNCPEYKMQN